MIVRRSSRRGGDSLATRTGGAPGPKYSYSPTEYSGRWERRDALGTHEVWCALERGDPVQKVYPYSFDDQRRRRQNGKADCIVESSDQHNYENYKGIFV